MKTQQDIINENIIEQLQIRISQDAEKIKEVENECTGLLLKLTDARNENERLKVALKRVIHELDRDEPNLTLTYYVAQEGLMIV